MQRSPEEIIRAVEICSKGIPCNRDIVFFQGKPIHELFAEIHWLLVRQKAEIERLQKEVAEHCLTVKQGIYHDGLQTSREWLIKHAKAEAIKEFAERLKERGKSLIQNRYSVYDVEYFIDCLVTEMVGDK